MSDSLFILRGSVINMIGMAIRAALSPLMMVIPRFFAQDIFGLFVFLRSLLSVFQQILGLGLGQGMAWWIPLRKREGRLSNGEIWGVMVFAVLCSTVGSGLLLGIFLVFKDHLPAVCRNAPLVFLCICFATIPGMVALTTACGCMDGIRKPVYRAFFSQSLALGLIPILILAFLFVGIPDALAWGLFGANWLCAVIVVWQMRSFFPRGSDKLDLVPERSLFNYSVFLSFGRWVTSGLVNLDLWLVVFFLGASDAAIYGIMLMLSNSIRSVRRSYEPMIVPVVSGLEPEGLRSKLPVILNYVTHMISSLQLVVAIFITCFYRELLSISGQQYSQYPTVFLILVAANLVEGFYSASTQVLFGLGKSPDMLKVRLIVLGFAIASGLALVTRYGMAGAAATSLLIGIVNAAILFYMQADICGKWPYQKIFYVNGALIAVFIVVSLSVAPLLPQTGLLLRFCVFVLLTICLGSLAYGARKSFIPR